MSARIEWMTTGSASAAVLDSADEAPDGQFLEGSDAGLLITGPDGDGIVVEGSHLDIIRWLVAVTKQVTADAMEQET